MKKEDKNKIYQLLELIYPDKSKEVLDNIINNIDNDISSDYLGNEIKDWDQKTCVLITYADSIYEEISLMKEVVNLIRKTRSDLHVHPKSMINAFFVSDDNNFNEIIFYFH